MSENLQDEQTELSGRSTEAEADPFYTYVRFIGLWIGTPVFLLVASVLTVYVYWKGQYERELQKLRDRGVPVEAADLQKRYDRRYPEQQPLYSVLPREFAEKHFAPVVGDKTFPSIDPEKRPIRSYTQKEVRTIRDHLPKYRKWINKMRNAKMKAPEMNYENGIHMQTPSFINNRAIAQLLVYQGVLALQDGGINEVVQIIKTLYRRVNYLMKPANTLSYLSANTVLDYAFFLHVKVLNQKQIRMHHLKTLQKYPRPDKIYTALRKSIEVDRVQFHQTFNRNSNIADKFHLIRSVPPLHLKNQVNLLRDFRTYLKRMNAPFYKAEPALTRLRERIEERWAVFGGYSRQAIPSGEIVVARDNTFLKAKLLKLATRARRHRLQHGEWPDLKSKVASIMDPFTGKPCRVRTMGKWIRLYGAGEDQTYDQGAAEKDVSIWLRKKPSGPNED